MKITVIPETNDAVRAAVEAFGRYEYYDGAVNWPQYPFAENELVWSFFFASFSPNSKNGIVSCEAAMEIAGAFPGKPRNSDMVATLAYDVMSVISNLASTRRANGDSLVMKVSDPIISEFHDADRVIQGIVCSFQLDI